MYILQEVSLGGVGVMFGVGEVRILKVLDEKIKFFRLQYQMIECGVGCMRERVYRRKRGRERKEGCRVEGYFLKFRNFICSMFFLG